MKRFGKTLKLAFAAGLLCTALSISTAKAAAPCKGPLEWDDTLYETNCCAGGAVPGSTVCDNPDDYGTTWESCRHLCAPYAE